jgi:hypothetical protein
MMIVDYASRYLIGLCRVQALAGAPRHLPVQGPERYADAGYQPDAPLASEPAG